jgi:hypothetical protein
VEDRELSSVSDFIAFATGLRRINTYFWFRGEPGPAAPSCRPLLPKVWRKTHNENSLNQLFRLRAPSLSPTPCPDREAIDEWLFLAQHVGLPTRLLDWSEGALAGLYFALLADDPVVWVLDPRALNRLSPPYKDDFPLTWVDPQDPKAIGNIRLAWGDTDPTANSDAVERPVAVLPPYIHPRMSVQRSCFTIHGRNDASLVEQLGTTESPLVARVHVDATPQRRRTMLEELHYLGVSGTTMFPDLQGLAQEIASLE